MITQKVNNELKLGFDDVLITPKQGCANSRKDVCLERTFLFNNKVSWTGIPIIASNMDTTGTFEMAKTLSKFKLLTCIHKYYTLSEWKKFVTNNPNCLHYTIVSCGFNESKKVGSILSLSDKLKFVCLDVANGYTNQFLNVIRTLRRNHPNIVLIAGNIVTEKRARILFNFGVDILKIGIGSGSVCLTRSQTGVGYPQLSAVLECKEASNKNQFNTKYILSDGGCKCPGDVAKAFGAGADFVMIGGMFAGHSQCNGEVKAKNGKLYKSFYGMSSKKAMKKYSNNKSYRSSEGKVVDILYKGDIEKTIRNILGGLRSSLTYVGVHLIQNFYNNVTFVRTHIQLNNVFK